MEETPFTQSHNVTVKQKEVNTEKTNKPSCFKNTIAYFCNFCDNTSIHGFKFFGESGRNPIERIFWLVVICAAIYGSRTLIYKTYLQWITSPIVVTFAMTETPIWQIPFPAVTICSEINADPIFFNYTDVYLKYKNEENTTEDDDNFFKIYSLFCNEKLEFVNENETKFLSEEEEMYLAVTYGGMSPENCKWLGNDIDCSDSLILTATSEGWCQTFNMIPHEEIYKEVDDIYENRTSNATQLKSWSLEEGYPPGVGLNTFPYRTMISGVNGGFQIDFDVFADDLDYLCTDLQGYKVTLHHPAESPNMDKYFRVPLNQVVVAGIRPRMITTSDEIKSYKPEDRLCYVPGEKYLKLFKTYSQQNCLFECLANYTLIECNCTSFYVSDNNVVCGAGSRKCVNKAKIEFLQKEVDAEITGFEGSTTTKSLCDCLPACTSIEFDSETSQTDWEWRKVNKLRYNETESENILYSKHHKSRLLVYYKDLQFMTSERHELYGITDFLANCGGLLGLCCGFSFISLMEIVYYLTLRLASNIKKFGYKFWSGSEKLIINDSDSEG